MDSASFRPGEVVDHNAWGRGVVQHVTAERVTVQFAAGGYRTLDIERVLEGDLLRAADDVPAVVPR